MFTTSSRNTGASNGLSKVNGRIQLGGIVTGATTITGTTGSSLNLYSKNLIIGNNEAEFGFVDRTGEYFGEGFQSFQGFEYISKVMYDHAGRLVVGGGFVGYRNNNLKALVRINPDGTEDTTFNMGSGVEGTTPFVYGIVESGTTLIFGGIFDSYNGVTGNFFKVDETGAIDTDFNDNIGSGFDNYIGNISIQSNGKILVGGLFNTFNGEYRPSILRLNADGTLDNTFDSGVTATMVGNQGVFYLQSDDKILVPSGNTVIRLNEDGTHDTGYVVEPGYYGMFVLGMQSTNKLIVNKSFYDGYQVIRLNTDGSVDGSYLGYYKANTSNPLISVLDDDRLILTIFQDSQTFELLSVDGSLINKIDIGQGAVGYQPTMNVMTSINSDKYLVYGRFDSFNGLATRLLVEIFDDGSAIQKGINVKTSDLFITSSGVTRIQNDTGAGLFINQNGVGTVELKSTTEANIKSGQIGIVADNELSLNFNSRVQEGSLGSTYKYREFGAGFTDVSNINQATFGSTSDSLLIVGAFNSYNNYVKSNIVRIDVSTGAIDTTFPMGNGVNGEAWLAKFDQNYQKYYIAGSFTTYSGLTAQYFARLNYDGSLDDTWANMSGFDGSPRDVAFHPDGTIVFGGGFTSYSGYSSQYMIKLNQNGTIDNTFNIGGGFDNVVYSLIANNDGTIVAGGYFTSFSGESHNRIVRLLSTGAIDNTFSGATGAGFDNVVTAMVKQSDGKIIAIGSFTTYDGFSAPYGIVRINTDGSVDTGFTSNANNASTPSVIPPTSLYLDGGENVIITGFWYDTNTGHKLGVKSLNPDGTLNPGSINTNLTTTGIVQYGVRDDNRGRIILLGQITSMSNYRTDLGETINVDIAGIASVQSNTGIFEITPGLILNDSFFEYDSNHGGRFTLRSLVDREYVDSRVNGVASSITQGSSKLKIQIITTDGQQIQDDRDVALVNTSTTSKTVYLPGSPLEGQRVIVKDSSNNAFTNNISLNGNGHNIEEDSDFTINTDGGGVELLYSNTLGVWTIMTILIGAS